MTISKKLVSDLISIAKNVYSNKIDSKLIKMCTVLEHYLLNIIEDP